MAEQTAELSYAVRFRVLFRYLGLLCMVTSVLTLIPLAVAFFFDELGAGFRYLAVVLGLLAVGVLLSRIRVPPGIQVNEAMVLAASLFVLTPLVMTFPIMTAGLGFVDALFEAISGMTTTGLSTLASVEDRPQHFLFVRAWLQWYGGLGIVVLSLALVIRPGLAAKGLAAAEGGEDDLIGGTKAHAKRVLLVYCIISGAGIIVLWLLGIDFFDGVLYALASVSTGGFSPRDHSLAEATWPVRTAVMLLCLSCAVSLPFYSKLYRKQKHRLVGLIQLRGVIMGALLAALLIALFIWTSGRPSSRQRLFHAPFLAFTAHTTAGFSTMDPAKLDPASKLVLICAMSVGGSVGSTAGGFKILRLLIFLQLAHMLMVRTRLTRHAFFEPRLAGQRLERTEMHEALLIMLLFFIVVVCSWLPFLAMGLNPLDSLFEVVSATGTVGLSVGVTHQALPSFLKGVLCLDMLMGRLEVIAWLVVFSTGTCIGRRIEGP